MSFKTVIAAVMVMAIPASALAGAVTLKNKDGKETTILVKRSNSTTETAIAGKASMELPGAPVIITVKRTGAKIEARDGETVIISKGQLSKLTPPPEPTEESTPAPPDEVPPPPPEKTE